MSEKLNEVLDEFISTPVLINLYEEDLNPILNLGNQKEVFSFKDFNTFKEYLDLDYNGLIILINSHEHFKLEEVEEIEKILEVKYGRRFIIGAKIEERVDTQYRVIAIKNTSNDKKYIQENYLARTKELLDLFEENAHQLEKTLIELDVSDKEKEKLLLRIENFKELV